MSHFTVMVVGENPEEQLEPFRENDESFVSNSKFDWYELGGRWTGSLKLKDGRSGVTGTPGVITNNANKGFCDQARLQDIDFDNMGNDFSVFAVLKDGKWYERGEMGW